jgi:hypothetical protein
MRLGAGSIGICDEFPLQRPVIQSAVSRPFTFIGSYMTDLGIMSSVVMEAGSDFFSTESGPLHIGFLNHNPSFFQSKALYIGFLCKDQ